MKTRLAFDYSNALGFLSEDEWTEALDRAVQSHERLLSRKGPGNEFLGWIDLPETIGQLVPELLDASERIQDQSETLVVTGIGGSYLGARAVIEACAVPFERPAVDIVYAGHHLDGRYFAKLLDYIEGIDFSVLVISKSGTTTEPAIAFRVLRDVLNEQYDSIEARERIYAVTDAAKGALHDLAYKENYTSFVIPDDVGGRFSVFTPVGLLPIAAAGINIKALIEGAASMRRRVLIPDPKTNPALVYAAMRDALYRKGKKIEVLSSYQSSLQYVAEWWKQLFGESEGKNGKGIFPASVVQTTDLHSMGQYIQDGERTLFETFLTVEDQQLDVIINEAEDDSDGLNYLAGKTLAEVNLKAYEGTSLAHTSGGVPNARIMLPNQSPCAIGELLYFFEFAVALSGYSLGVNPFDQPGVEAYKANMFALLNKPGFEEQHEILSSLMTRQQGAIIE